MIIILLLVIILILLFRQSKSGNNVGGAMTFLMAILSVAIVGVFKLPTWCFWVLICSMPVIGFYICYKIATKR